ncbi:hypothetical protein AB834_07195 [PVC group bacterium (ex Bugula neritina AB1)]|nr:hypothetical protein AB834_07195 [PVC group bacterium (ex Bugula neritina AB1)]
MNITLSQINPTVGDISNNLLKIEKAISEAPTSTDLLIFSELALTGYPPRDLLKHPSFINSIVTAQKELEKISTKFPETGILIGTPTPTLKGNGLYNSARLFFKGKCIFEQHKYLIPSYDVFDETRYFNSPDYLHNKPKPLLFKKRCLGITICEDIWCLAPSTTKFLYPFDPVESLVSQGAELIINLSASPFEVNKPTVRYNLGHEYVKKYNIPFILVNQVGANDDLIFDGNSFAMNARGKFLSKLKNFEVDSQTFSLEQKSVISLSQNNSMEDLEKALILGIRDYFEKSKNEKAVLGLSGGLDSAVAAVLACKALGSQNVLGITMPSKYSSEGSAKDSYDLAKNLSLECKTISIENLVDTYSDLFKSSFSTPPAPSVEENIQARIRGNILMAFANQPKTLLITTGNKSEIAMGYCTLYGDMCGALAVISDIFKTTLYDFAKYINQEKDLIPQNILTKPPSAELKPNQKDEDTLPPYPILDAILTAYLIEKKSHKDIELMGFDKDLVFWILQRVDQNEHKRKQMPIGFKVSSCAFGKGRRMPIAMKIER